MLETPHVIVGAAIASKVGNPYLAIPAILASHFLLDRVPHWNPHLNTELKKYGAVTKRSATIIIVDLLLAGLSGIAIASTSLPDINQFGYILLGGFLGILPDVIEGPYFFLKWQPGLLKKWVRFQKSIQVDVSPVFGLTTQVVTIVASFVWIMN